MIADHYLCLVVAQLI
jgi:hypothetical protein